MANSIDEKLQYLSDTKEMIRQAISGKGQLMPTDLPFRNYVDKINDISAGIDTSDATATANDILSPKTAYVNDKKIQGSIVPIYELREITGTKINSTATSDYGISFLLPDNSTMAFVNQSTIYLKLSNGEIISRNIDLGNYYPHQAEIAELPYEDNKYYFAVCSYSSATQIVENKARIDIFSIDLDAISTDASNLELELIKTLSGLNMNYNQGCFTFAKQNSNILAYMERNTTHNLVSIYQISTNSYLVSAKDLGYKELDPNFLKFMNNDRLLVSYVTGYDDNWIFNLTNYTIDSYKLLYRNTKISTLDGVNYFYSYSNTETSKKELHYGTYNLTDGTTTSVASVSFSTNVLDVNILYKNENIYYIGVYCDSNMYLLKYDTDTKLFTTLKNTNGYGSIKENTVLSYGYNVLLHSIWSGKADVTLGLTLNIESTNKISSLTREDVKYFDTSNATAAAEHILKNKISYGEDGKIVGTLEMGLTKAEYDTALATTQMILNNIEYSVILSNSTKFDYNVSNNSRIVLDFSVVVESNSWHNMIGNNTKCLVEHNMGDGLYSFFWGDAEVNRKIDAIKGDGTRQKFDIHNGKLYVNDTLVAETTDDKTFSDVPLYLNDNGGSSNYTFYSMKIYESDKLVRDYKVNKLDNVLFIYDTITGHTITTS